jgi:hypothetical protein
MLFKIKNLLLVALTLFLASIQPLFANEAPKPSADGDLLMEAIDKNDEAKVDELLSMKIDPNSRGHEKQGLSPLKLAARKGNKHIVDMLIKYGADIKPIRSRTKSTYVFIGIILSKEAISVLKRHF